MSWVKLKSQTSSDGNKTGTQKIGLFEPLERAIDEKAAAKSINPPTTHTWQSSRPPMPLKRSLILPFHPHSTTSQTLTLLRDQTQDDTQRCPPDKTY